MSGFRPALDFSNAPTLSEAFLSPAFVRVIWGPVGSGKSTLCCGAIMSSAMRQPVVNGVRPSRHIIVRNTYPDLKGTTVNTWKRIFPERYCGPIVYSAPITHRIRVEPRLLSREADIPGLDCEVIFLAMDQPEDVDKLRSFDITTGWINEGALVPLSAAQMMIRRVGRYPEKQTLADGTVIEAVQPGVLIDSNASDEDSELRVQELDAPANWAFFHQPPAVLEVTLVGSKCVCIEPDPRYSGRTFQHSQVIKAAGKTWVVNPEAENLRNLIRGYYENQLPGSTLEQIQRDMQGKFVYVQEGRPVVPEFSVEIHVDAELAPVAGVPLQFGGDIGGGTTNPAVVMGQRYGRALLIHDELVCGDVGIADFCQEFSHAVATREHLQGLTFGRFHGDPAGNKPDEYFKVIVFEHLRRAGFDAHPTWTNDVELRVQAVRNPFTRMVEKRPAIVIHPRCKKLIQALSGKWKMRRLQVSGPEARYADKPDKTHPWSDVGEALGYLALGTGEERELRGRNEPKVARAGAFPTRTVQARVDFDIFGNS